MQSIVVDSGASKAGLRCSACAETAWLATSIDANLSPLASEAENKSLGDATLGPSDPAETPTTSGDDDVRAREALSENDVSLDANLDASLKKALLTLDDNDDTEDLRREFVALLDNWENDDAHKKVLSRAVIGGHLAIVGQSYRTVLDSRPEDGIAINGRERVLASAMVQMTELPGADSDLVRSKKGLTMIAMAACTVILLVCGYYVFTVTLPQLIDPEGTAEMPRKRSLPAVGARQR